MKNIFLAAKYIAIQKGKDYIEPQDIFAAINAMSFVDDKFKSVLEPLGLKNTSCNIKVNELALGVAAKKKRSNFLKRPII